MSHSDSTPLQELGATMSNEETYTWDNIPLEVIEDLDPSQAPTQHVLTARGLLVSEAWNLIGQRKRIIGERNIAHDRWVRLCDEEGQLINLINSVMDNLSKMENNR
jgi:hypothetical protein